MDREILFRGKVSGKRLNKGEWIEGNLVHQLDYYGKPCDKYFILNKYDTNDYEIGEPIQVIPATVGQFTFLNDIDDKKIFTADILQDKITGDLYVVDFIGGGFGLFTMKEYVDLKHRHQVILWDGLSELQTACFVSQNLEIVGNIHGNPELETKEESE